MELKKQTAIITGGGSGLGAATAYKLAEAGMNICIFDYDFEKADKVAKTLGGIAIKVDISDKQQVEKAIQHCSETLGAARVVINCAGIGVAARMVGKENKLSIDLFEKVIQINLLGSYYVMSFALRDMISLPPLDDGARGVIVNTSSAAYQDGQLGQVAYAASKGAIASMCLPAARELSQHGIRVCAIAPGLFNTPMMETLPEDVKKAIVRNIPYPNRLGNPEEFASLVKHICENNYLNGEIIRLDGSTRLPPR